MQQLPKIIYQNLANEFYTEERCHILEVFNQAEHPHCSIARARVGVGVSTQRHSLKETAEIYYILQGEGLMELDTKEMGILKKGDAVFIPANMSQKITNTGKEDLIFLCICTPRFEAKIYENREISAYGRRPTAK